MKKTIIIVGLMTLSFCISSESIANLNNSEEQNIIINKKWNGFSDFSKNPNKNFLGKTLKEIYDYGLEEGKENAIYTTVICKNDYYNCSYYLPREPWIENADIKIEENNGKLWIYALRNLEINFNSTSGENTHYFYLKKGINKLIKPPESEKYTTEDFCKLSDAISKVQGWKSGEWKTYACGAPFGNYVMDSNFEIWHIFVNENAQIFYETEKSNNYSFTLEKGITKLEKPPESGKYTTEDFCNLSSNITRIQGWETAASGWKTYSCGAPFGNYVMDNNFSIWNIFTNEDVEISYEIEDLNQNNKKNLNQYSSGQIFLASDEDWREVLPMIPVTVWTDKDGNIKKYPFLFYHEEDAYLDLEIDNWAVNGYYSNFKNGEDQGLEIDNIDEKNIQPSLGEKTNGNEWKKMSKESKAYFDISKEYSDLEYFDLEQVFGKQIDNSAYAHIYLYSPVDKNVIFEIASIDGIKLFINGQEELLDENGHKFNIVKENENSSNIVKKIDLKKGWNNILLKIRNGGTEIYGINEAWGFDIKIKSNDQNFIKNAYYQLDNPEEKSSVKYYFENKAAEKSYDVDSTTYFLEHFLPKKKITYSKNIPTKIKNVFTKEFPNLSLEKNNDYLSYWSEFNDVVLV